jgi:hypothetical protein
MKPKIKKSMVDSKTGEINLTGTTMEITSDIFLPSYYNYDDIEIERMMEQARVHVHTHNSPIRKRYLIPVKPLTKKNKKKSDNFFKRLFKTITKSVGLK